MKYLENERLTELTGELAGASLGQSHRVIDGRIEAYTMKRAGNDKKFAHTLGQKYVADLEEQQQLLADLSVGMNNNSMIAPPGRKRSNSVSIVEQGTSNKRQKQPVRARSQSVDLNFSSKTTLGDFSELATRRLMTDLILTLNASFPDYDFSNVKPNQFEKLPINNVRKRIYERLSELATFKPQKDFLVEMWMAVNDVIDLRECDVFGFEDDCFSDDDNNLWSFHYFFVNKSLRRLVFFTCSEKIDVKEVPEEGKISFYPSEAQLVDESLEESPGDVLTAGGGMSIPISTV